MKSRVNTIQNSRNLRLQAAKGAELVGISLVWSEVNKSSGIALRDIGNLFLLEKGMVRGFVTPVNTQKTKTI